jgi:hypothetical protein
MEMAHHRSVPREDDTEIVCRRCGLINPGDDDPCISVYYRFEQSEESEYITSSSES